mmetsp:Transcript_156080/g.299103  ORF Transcript_156080/g.299103 Transcript_156080/m.299103 type:complete len:166 (+) Transcript_156080:97-594(+)
MKTAASITIHFILLAAPAAASVALRGSAKAQPQVDPTFEQALEAAKFAFVTAGIPLEDTSKNEGEAVSEIQQGAQEGAQEDAVEGAEEGAVKGAEEEGAEEGAANGAEEGAAEGAAEGAEEGAEEAEEEGADEPREEDTENADKADEPTDVEKVHYFLLEKNAEQ